MDKSIKQGEEETPSIFSMVMKSIFVMLQKRWKRNCCGLGLKVFQDGKDEEQVINFIFADSRHLVFSSKKELCEMMLEATVMLRRRGLEWKQEEMEFCRLGSGGDCCWLEYPL